jgi:hypothetical protein
MRAIRTKKVTDQQTDAIVMVRAETRVDTWTCYDDAGDPVDITGFDFWFTVRRCPFADAVLQKTLIGGVSAGITLLNQTTNKGQFTVTINHADTLETTFPWGCGFEFDVFARDQSTQAYQQIQAAQPFILESAPTQFAA